MHIYIHVLFTILRTLKDILGIKALTFWVYYVSLLYISVVFLKNEFGVFCHYN